MNRSLLSLARPSRAPLTIATALGLALSIAALPAARAADDTPVPYVGGAVGGSHFSEPVDGIGGHSQGVDDKVYAGVALNPYLAVEAGWADLGHTRDADGRVTAHGGYLSMVGLAPVGAGVSLRGSVGIDHANLETTSGNDSGNGLLLGLGAQMDVAKNVDVRAEVERFQVHAFDERPDIHLFTVGMDVRF